MLYITLNACMVNLWIIDVDQSTQPYKEEDIKFLSF